MEVMNRVHAAGKRLQAEVNARYAADADQRLRVAEDAAINGDPEALDDADDDDVAVLHALGTAGIGAKQ